jgi:excisionase family DNA binding protein
MLLSMNDLLLASDVARLLGVSISAVRVWADRGDLRATRSPGGWRIFSREAVEKFREARAARQQRRALAREA